MEEIKRDPYFEKFINLTVDFITTEVREKLKEFKLNDDDEKLAYTPREAMKKLGVGQNTMYTDLLPREDFPSYKVGDKWFVSKKGLEEWVQNQHK